MNCMLISVIMPVYNGEKTLAEAMNSVREQTFPDWELILVEDCPSDHSPEKISEVLSSWPEEMRSRVRVWKNRENKGPAFCRNLGIGKARGEYIAFLDCDDRWRQDKLEKQAELLQKEPGRELIFTGSGFLKENGEAMEGYLPAPETVDFHELLRQNVISCSSVLVKKTLLLASSPDGKEIFPDTRKRKILMHEDFPVWLRCLRICGEARGIDEPLLLYRIQQGSQSGNKLKAAGMTYAVYRFMGIGIPGRWLCFCSYAMRSLRKYRRIRQKARE